MNLTISGQYRLIKKLGSGSFGEVYKAIDIKTNREVAAKLELVTSKHPQLKNEAQVYKVLQGSVGIPKIYWSGSNGDYTVMVIDLLGPSLEDLFNLSHKKFSLKTVIMIVIQMIDRIEWFHTHEYLHRDVKPDNFLLGIEENKNNIYIVDYGLAKKYYDSLTLTHISYREKKNLTGTARYASLNTHLGIEQSRRDDLEGIGYVIMYFLRGSLPWQGLKVSTQGKRYNAIREIKYKTTIKSLCENYPEEFKIYLEYCRALKFYDTPDYRYLKKLFSDLFIKLEYKWDYLYDWVLPPNDSRSAQSTEAPNEERKEKLPKLIIEPRKRLLPFGFKDFGIEKHKIYFKITKVQM